MKNKWKYFLIGFIIFLLAACYVSGAIYYKDRLFRNTMVNNRSLANMTVQEAEDTFIKDLKSHQITVKEKEREEIINASDCGVVIDVGSQIKDLQASQNRWEWPLHFFGKSTDNIKLDIQCDQAMVTQTVGAMECFLKENVVAPEDAYIEAGATEFAIVPEVLGNTVKKAQLISKVQDAFVNNVTNIDLEGEDLYYLPKIYAADQNINDALALANKYSHASITYDYTYTKETLDYKTLKDWIDISKDFKVTVNNSKAGDYVAYMQEEYNTMGTARHFKTATGKKIIITQGDYGWKVHYKKEKEKMLKNIKSGKTLTREPVWEYKGLVRKGKRDDIGDTYVEVSIDDQEVWMIYKGEDIASSSCVTGNPNKNAGTTKGIYSITFKKTPATLTGPDAQGGQYASDVTYWMPFNGNQGLHDAPWRDSFGGNIYKSNGSHGCVNLPFDMAQTIWNHVKEGYPVIIY